MGLANDFYPDAVGFDFNQIFHAVSTKKITKRYFCSCFYHYNWCLMSARFYREFSEAFSSNNSLYDNFVLSSNFSVLFVIHRQLTFDESTKNYKHIASVDR